MVEKMILRFRRVSAFAKTVKKFGAMPAVWRNLSIERRHAVAAIIDNFIATIHDAKTAWSAENT
jgi:hypothetical protein